MPRPVTFVGVSLLCAVVGCGKSAPTWGEHSPEGAGFKIKLPGKPELKSDADSKSIGGSNAVGDAFIVYWSPSPARDPAVPEAYANSTAETWGTAVKKREKKPINLDGHPGIEQRMELSSGVLFRERFYLVGGTLYRLQVGGLVSRGLDNPDVEQFFNSFSLTSTVEPVAAKPAPPPTPEPPKPEPPKKDDTPPPAPKGPTQDEAVTALKASGAKVYYDFQEPKLLDGVFFPRPITDADVPLLLALPALRSVTVESAALTDDGLRTIAKLTNLQLLTLKSEGITDAGLAHLTPLRKLQMLALPRTKVAGPGLIHLAGAPQGLTLELDDCPVTDDGLAVVKNLPNLRWLVLIRTKVTDAGLVHLEGLTNLEHLNLGGTAVTGSGLKHVAKLPKLNWLHLSSTPLTDAGIAALAPAPALKNLSLFNCKKITAEGIKAVALIKPLEDLSAEKVGDPPIPASVFDELKKAKPDLRISR